MTADEKDARIAELEAQLVARDARIAELAEQVAALLKKVEELNELLGRNSGNSHLPPSSDPPGANKPGQKKSAPFSHTPMLP